MSMGTYGIVCLMLESYLASYAGRLYPGSSSTDTGSSLIDNVLSGTAFLSHLSPEPTTHLFVKPVESKNARLLSSLIEGHEKQQQASSYLSSNPIEAKVMLASAFAFYTGIFHVQFYQLQNLKLKQFQFLRSLKIFKR